MWCFLTHHSRMHTHAHAYTHAQTHHTCTSHTHHARTHAHTHTHTLWFMLFIIFDLYSTYSPIFYLLQVELALDVESIVPQFIRRRFVVKSRTIRPNATRHYCSVFRHLMAESELSSEAIVKALNPELVCCIHY